MRAETRRLLQDLLDLVGDDLEVRVRALREPLDKGFDDRLAGETSPERRKRLETLQKAIASGWDGFATTLDRSFRHEVAVEAGWQEDDDSELARGMSSLKLVDDDEVEWDLAVAGAVSRMKAAGGSALSEFEQRVIGLLGDAQLDNPVSLDAVGIGLRRAIEELSAEPAERRALLAYVEPLLSKEMEALCEAANEFLAERGVGLPRLKPAIGARGPAAASMVSGGGGSPGGGAAGGDGGGDVLSLLQRLVQNAPGGTVGAATGGPAMPSPFAAGASGGGAALAAGMVAVPAAMLESLERLQAIDLQAIQAAPAAGQATTRGGNVLHELRQQDFARALPPIEAATIDIVAMLFDFIFDDRLVPDTVKALVGRLQIPLLKVAMVDKSFFSNREHPARALLDAISRASIAAGADLDHGHPVFEKIRVAVNRVLAEFEKDPGVFAALLPEIQAMQGEQEALANELAEKSRAVAERQEQEDLAELRAHEACLHVLEEKGGEALPAVVREFLARHWTTVLRFAWLKGGSSGHPWLLALQTLNELLWTLAPKSDADARQKLVALLPDLLRRVNAFLDRVGVGADDKSPFLDALVEIHSAALKPPRRPSRTRPPVEPAAEKTEVPLAPPPALVAAAEAPPEVVSQVFEEGGLHVQSMALSGKTPALRPGRVGEAGRLERGDWVEFKQEDGSVVRGRLSWVSPQRGIMLFTNPQSSKAISISPEALALQMKRGLATRLAEADEPLVDRALGRAMDSLKAA